MSNYYAAMLSKGNLGTDVLKRMFHNIQFEFFI